MCAVGSTHLMARADAAWLHMPGLTAGAPATGLIDIRMPICSYAGDLPSAIVVGETPAPDNHDLLEALGDEGDSWQLP